MKKNYPHNEKSTNKEFDSVYQHLSTISDQSLQKRSLEITNGIPEEKNMEEGKIYAGSDGTEVIMKIKINGIVKILS